MFTLYRIAFHGERYFRSEFGTLLLKVVRPVSERCGFAVQNDTNVEPSISSCLILYSLELKDIDLN